MATPDVSYYIDQWCDDNMPCDPSLNGWAEWLSQPSKEYKRDEPAKDGETFNASAIAWQADIVATLREGNEWTFSAPIPADASIMAVRFGPGLGWDCDSVAHDEESLRAVLSEVGGPEIGCTEHIAIGVEQPDVTLVYRVNPPRMEIAS